MSVAFKTIESDSPVPALSVFAIIAKAFEGEKHLLPATGDELLQSFVDGLAILGVNEEGEPVAFARLIPLLEPESEAQWYELGSTWVRKDSRGRQLNHEMYRVFLPLHTEKNILATTTNRASRSVGRDMGMVLVKRRKLPEAVWKGTCICPSSKTGCEQKNTSCKLAHGEPQHTGADTCWLRITGETLTRMRSPER